MAIADLDAVKALLGVSGTASDAKLTLACAAADAAAKSYTKRALESAGYTAYLSGSGRPELVLPQRPVTEVTGVWLDPQGYFGKRAGGFAAATELTEGADFVGKYDDPENPGWSRSGLLLRVGGGVGPANPGWWPDRAEASGGLSYAKAPSWPRGYGNVKVTYTAGYDPVPDDLQMACNQLAIWIGQAAPRGGMPVVGEGYGDQAANYSVSLALQALQGADPALGTVRRTLMRYREVSL